MSPSEDNRAVSALFRVFGGEERPVVADDHEIARERGMHRGEAAVFSILVPLTVLVAAGDGIGKWLGPVGGWLLTLPAAWLALHALPFLLGTKNRGLQWVLWLGVFVGWALWRRHAGGVAGLFAHVWIGIGVMNLAAACVLDWRTSMSWKGKGGIAWRMMVMVLLHAAAVGIGFRFGWPWGVLAAAGIGGLCAHAILNPSSQWLGPVYRTTDLREILITIDDGPDPHNTPVLLDLLERHHANAIFFVIGEKARAHPDLIREILRRGHEVGNHTLTHPARSFWCAGPWRTWREIAGCQRVVGEITGKRPRWFRAPVGHRNLFTHPIAGALGMRVMGWNRRGFDAVEKDAAKVLGRIVPNLAAGDIVLLHEATPIAERVLAGVLAKSHPL